MVGCVDPDDLSARLFKVRKNDYYINSRFLFQTIGEVWNSPSDVCISRECISNNNIVETTPVKPNTSDPCDPAPTCAANERLITVEPDFSAGECCPTYECFKGCWEVQTLNGVDTYIKEIVQKPYPESCTVRCA